MQNRNSAPSERLPLRQLGIPESTAARRANHGGSGWSLPSRLSACLQPQDGSQAAAPRVARMPVRPGSWKLACESDDARITGTTRSLSRRVLGLNNVAADQRKNPLATSALPAQVA